MSYNRFGDDMASKTNAVRLIQAAGIPCRESFYEFDEKDLNGNHAAKAIGMPPEQVFKTLVARGERTGIHVFCIPVCCELDLKKAAKAAGDKNMEMVPVKELLSLTGDHGGGAVILRHEEDLIIVEADPKELMDVDTPDALNEVVNGL